MPSIQTKLFSVLGFTVSGSCPWEIRIIHCVQLNTALYPALLRNPRGKYEQPVLPMQIRCFHLDKAFTGWVFFPHLRPERNWYFCFAHVTSCMVYFFSRKHLCVEMRDVKLLVVLKSPRTVSCSTWILTQPRFDICFQGWMCYNTVQKWGIKPGQQEDTTRGTGLRPATAKQEEVTAETPCTPLLMYGTITSVFL